MLDLANKLLSLSQEMLSYAQSAEWENVAHSQEKRVQIVKLIDELDLSTLDQESSIKLGELLTQSRELEKQCMQLTESAQNDLTTEKAKISKGKAMRKAYGAHGNRR